MPPEPCHLSNDLEQMHARYVRIDFASTIIRISGKDAKKFLQGQVTCNLDDMPIEKCTLGAHCNPQGRIVFLFRLWQYHDDYYLFFPLNMTAIALQALKKYAVFYKVQLEVQSVNAGIHVSGLCGAQIADLLANDSLLASEPDSFICVNGDVIITLPGQPVRYLLVSQVNSVIYSKLKQEAHWMAR